MNYDPNHLHWGRVALSFGWLSQEQATWCLHEATRRGLSMAELALQSRLLNEAQCQQIQHQLIGGQDAQQTVLGGAPAQPLPAPSPEAPTSVPEAGLQGSPARGPSSTGSGAQSRPEIGDQFDQYLITRLLGEGGMGAVYAAKQGEVEYALKVITTPNFSALARFEREAMAVAEVDSHPNIVKIHKYSRFQGIPYLVFDLIEGKSLDHYIHPGQPYGIEESVSIIQTVADALRFSHEKGVLHRDLKPANVLLRSDGTPFLTDFGLAKSKDSDSLTQSSDFLGTPHYMSPEQAGSENDKVGPRSDVWALGAILYELVTGFKPFPGGTVLQTVNAILFRDPIDPRKHNEKLSEDLETIILQCLNKDIEKRYESAAALAEDCRRLLSGEPIQGKRLSAYERTLGRLRRRYGRALVWGLYAVILGLVIILAGLAYFYLVVKPYRDAQQSLRDDYRALTAELPSSRGESALMAAEDALEVLDLLYLMGRIRPRDLRVDAVLAKQRGFEKEKARFLNAYSIEELPELLKGRGGKERLEQAAFVERLARLRAGKDLVGAQGAGSVSKSAKSRVERQFLAALGAMKNGLWEEGYEALDELGRLSKAKASRTKSDSQLFFTQFEELSVLLRGLLVVNGKVTSTRKKSDGRRQILETCLTKSSWSAAFSGIGVYFQLKRREDATKEGLFQRGLAKQDYQSKGLAQALTLCGAYSDYKSALMKSLGESLTKEQPAWDRVVAEQRTLMVARFRGDIIAETLKLSTLGSRKDRELYYQLLDLFYKTQSPELKKQYAFFNLADFKLFYTGYKNAFSVYSKLKEDPKTEAEAYDYWKDALDYARRCQSLDPKFKLPTQFSRDGITLIIQRGYLLARQQAKLKQFDMGRKTGLEEMSRFDWSLLYQLILAGSRAGVYSQFMGREVMEPLLEKGIFTEEIRKRPGDAYCHFWRGMVGPIISIASRETDDATKTESTYWRLVDQCIDDLNTALKSQTLHDGFRAVALTERLYLYQKKFKHAGALRKLGGYEAVQKDMDWAVTHHPAPEIPLYLVVKFRRDWPVTKHLKEMDRVQELIDKRWDLSQQSSAGRSTSYWLAQDRPPNNPRQPMTPLEKESLNQRLIRGRVNRLNVHGDHKEALRLIELGLKHRVRAELLCEKTLAYLGLGQISEARVTYSRLLSIHDKRRAIEHWGEDRMKKLRLAMAEHLNEKPK